MNKTRDQLASRLGFLLLSAGCAIGLGNVWRFPYVVGKYGGLLFLVAYFFFLLAVSLPIMVMEFSAGRASQKQWRAVIMNSAPPRAGACSAGSVTLVRLF